MAAYHGRMAESGAPVSPIREQQRAFTRERLVRAGAEVFERKGYLAVTVDDIVGAAGASRATFYLHFRTKADVLNELGSRLVPEVQELYSDLDHVLETGSREAMREWMGGALRWMEHHRAVMAAADTAAFLEGPNSFRPTSSFVESMPRWLARWPPSRRHEAALRIALLIAQFRALFAFPLSDEAERPGGVHDGLVEAMTDIWLAGLTPPPDPG